MKIKKYEELTFTDDFMFCKVMANNLSLCKELLELILNIKIREIVDVTNQKTIDIKADAKSVRLDVYVEDEKESVYDVEMQTTLKKDLPKRSRYYQGMIDLNLIEKGAKYSELKKSYIIFICMEDPFDRNLPLYTFENICKEAGDLPLGDETVKVFVNAGGEAEGMSEELRGFLEYLSKGSAREDSFASRIDGEVKKAREHLEWRNEYMTLQMHYDEIAEEARAEGHALGHAEGHALGRAEGHALGHALGRTEAIREMIAEMLRSEVPVSLIAKYSKESEDMIRKIKNELNIG